MAADVVVIGGGLCGVMTAWRLAKAGQSVVILEKNHIGTGDTGLTTGFLTRVPDVSIAVIQKEYGKDFVGKLFAATQAAQENIFGILKDEKLACDFTNCHAYYGSYVRGDETLKKELLALQSGGIGVNEVREKSDRIPFVEAVQFAEEGKWNVRKFLFALLQTEIGKKIQVFEETEATELIVAERVAVKTATGAAVGKKVVVAIGNPAALMGETRDLVSEKITYVMAARFVRAPAGGDVYWDTGDPYFYYRMIDDRTLIVGGCDIEATKTSEQKPYEKLRAFVTERFGKDFEVTNEWAGSIFHTADGLPYVFAHPHYAQKVFVATGFGGNGMIGSILASDILSAYCQGQTHAGAELFRLERTRAKVGVPQPKQPKATGVKQFVFVGTTSEFKNCQCLQNR